MYAYIHAHTHTLTPVHPAQAKSDVARVMISVLVLNGTANFLTFIGMLIATSAGERAST